MGALEHHFKSPQEVQFRFGTTFVNSEAEIQPAPEEHRIPTPPPIEPNTSSAAQITEEHPIPIQLPVEQQILPEPKKIDPERQKLNPMDINNIQAYISKKDPFLAYSSHAYKAGNYSKSEILNFIQENDGTGSTYKYFDLSQKYDTCVYKLGNGMNAYEIFIDGDEQRPEITIVTNETRYREKREAIKREITVQVQNILNSKDNDQPYVLYSNIGNDLCNQIINGIQQNGFYKFGKDAPLAAYKIDLLYLLSDIGIIPQNVAYNFLHNVQDDKTFSQNDTERFFSSSNNQVLLWQIDIQAARSFSILRKTRASELANKLEIFIDLLPYTEKMTIDKLNLLDLYIQQTRNYYDSYQQKLINDLVEENKNNVFFTAFLRKNREYLKRLFPSITIDPTDGKLYSWANLEDDTEEAPVSRKAEMSAD